MVDDEESDQAVLDALHLTITGLQSAAALLNQQNVELRRRVADLAAENKVLRAAADNPLAGKGNP